MGLYWQGILHDLSKYSPSEFLVGARYYQGNRSPNNAEREELGYSSSWMHHKGRNKHHYEYWNDYAPVNAGRVIASVQMPTRYVVEMFMDRIAASKVYNKGNYKDSHPLQYYQNGLEKSPELLHPRTKKQLESLLIMLAEQGEDKTFAYIKASVLRKKGGH